MPRTAPPPPAAAPDIDPSLQILSELRERAAAVTAAEHQHLAAAERAKELREVLTAAREAEHAYVLKITHAEPMPLFDGHHAATAAREPTGNGQGPSEVDRDWPRIFLDAIGLLDEDQLQGLADKGIERIGELADQLTLATTLGLPQKLVKKLLACIAAFREKAGEPAPAPVQGTLSTWRDTTIGMVTELTMGEAQRLRNLGILHLGDLADKLDAGDYLGLAARTVKKLQARIAKDKSEETP